MYPGFVFWLGYTFLSHRFSVVFVTHLQTGYLTEHSFRHRQKSHLDVMNLEAAALNHSILQKKVPRYVIGENNRVFYRNWATLFSDVVS